MRHSSHVFTNCIEILQMLNVKLALCENNGAFTSISFIQVKGSCCWESFPKDISCCGAMQVCSEFSLHACTQQCSATSSTLTTPPSPLAQIAESRNKFSLLILSASLCSAIWPRCVSATKFSINNWPDHPPPPPPHTAPTPDGHPDFCTNSLLQNNGLLILITIMVSSGGATAPLSPSHTYSCIGSTCCTDFFFSGNVQNTMHSMTCYFKM